jgi:hypothetical protein
VDGNYNMYGYMYYSLKIPKTPLRFTVNPNVNISRNTNFANHIKNLTQNGSYTLGISLAIDKENKYDISLSPSVTYNTSKSSININGSTKYWSYQQSADINITLPFKFDLNTDANYNFRQKINSFDKDNSVLAWNANIEKKLFKNDQLVLKFSINDILNQNQGFSRVITATTVEERNYTTFVRYAMLSATWNFNKNGGAPKSMF